MKYGRLRQNEAKLIPLNQSDKILKIFRNKSEIILIQKYNFRKMSPTTIDPYQALISI